MTDGTATDRARELGTAHGKAAAVAWYQRGYTSGWPVPDLSGEEVDRIYGDVTVELPVYMATCEAYEAAFTAAVEATVREAVR